MLLAIVALLTATYLILFRHQWIPIHDELNFVFSTHFLYSHFNFDDLFPLWLPFVTWGKANYFNLVNHIKPSTYFLLPLKFAFPDLNAVTLHYAAILINELILFVGTLALARKVFPVKLIALLVSGVLVGSNVWFSEDTFSFQIFYSLPIAMYLIWQGCTKQTPWRILLAFCLLVVLVVGGAVYILFPQVLFCAVFLVACLWYFKVPIRALALKDIGLSALFLMVLVSLLLLPYLLIKADSFVAYTGPGRTAGVSLAYHTYLNYGLDPALQTLRGIATGIAPHRDVSVFTGIVVLPAALVAVMFFPSAAMAPFLLCAAFVLLMYLGGYSLIAPLTFDLSGGIFRHLAYVITILKVPLVFLAGFGLSGLLEQIRTNPRRAIYPLAVLFAGLALVLLLSVYPTGLSRRFLLNLLLVVAYLATFCGLLWNPKIAPGKYVWLLGFVAVFDAFSYKSMVMHATLNPVPRAQWETFRLRPIEFAVARPSNPFGNAQFSAWAGLINESAPGNPLTEEAFLKCQQGNGCAGVYWYINDKWAGFYDAYEQFLGFDPCFTLFRYDMLSRSVADFIKDTGVNPVRLLRVRGSPSDELDPLRRIAGCDGSKLQWHAHLSALPRPFALQAVNPAGGAATVAAREFYEVQKFTPNEFWLRVRSDGGGSGYLYYADAFDPKWQVWVDGEARPILRANTAFRAVEIPAGEHQVSFRYRDPLAQGLLMVLWIVSTIAVAMFFVWSWRVLREF
jgi:hypothetical protein